MLKTSKLKALYWVFVLVFLLFGFLFLKIQQSSSKNTLFNSISTKINISEPIYGKILNNIVKQKSFSNFITKEDIDSSYSSEQRILEIKNSPKNWSTQNSPITIVYPETIPSDFEISIIWQHGVSGYCDYNISKDGFKSKNTYSNLSKDSLNKLYPFVLDNIISQEFPINEQLRDSYKEPLQCIDCYPLIYKLSVTVDGKEYRYDFTFVDDIYLKDAYILREIIYNLFVDDIEKFTTYNAMRYGNHFKWYEIDNSVCKNYDTDIIDECITQEYRNGNLNLTHYRNHPMVTLGNKTYMIGTISDKQCVNRIYKTPSIECTGNSNTYISQVTDIEKLIYLMFLIRNPHVF